MITYKAVKLGSCRPNDQLRHHAKAQLRSCVMGIMRVGQSDAGPPPATC